MLYPRNSSIESFQQPMIGRLLHRYGQHFILLMMLSTRIFGTVGGLLVVYYVEFTMQMPDSARMHFRITSLIVVIIACVLTVLMAMRETRHLRLVLKLLKGGQEVDPNVGSEAGREAVGFAARHHRNEAWLVPCSTWVPVLIVLKVVDNASLGVMANITIAVFMATSMALMSHFFATERCMKAVVRYLLKHGISIDYESIKPGRLRFRMRVCFTLIIATTALMIGTMANQRAAEMIATPDAQLRLVHELRYHSVFITLAALILGIVYSTIVADSVAQRVSDLVTSIDRVGSGDLTERVLPTGNDEIDVLARRFNLMVEQTAISHQTIRDLNVNLEQKVSQRTQELNDTVNALRETQEKLTAYNEESERARADAESANNAKSEFLTNISHELRTPLNGVIGLNDLLMNTHLDEQQLKYVQSARSSGETLLHLLNDLLDFSKIEAGKLDLEEIEFDLIQAIESVMNTVAHRCKDTVELICSIDPTMPTRLLGDPGRLHQILTNLTNNALKFTDSGEILVRVECLSNDEQSATIRFGVRDTGIGIAEDQIDRIFEAFTQADASTTRKYGGTGLGLGICKQLCETMGGNIGATSEMGIGSQFFFTLTLAKASTTTPLQAVPPNAADARILVADSNVSVCESLLQSLTAIGMQVDTTNSAADAHARLSAAVQQGKPYRLAIVEKDLAESRDGPWTQVAGDEHDDKKTKFVALIPLARYVDINRLQDDGFVDYLSKPAMPSETHRKVFAALSTSSRPSQDQGRSRSDRSRLETKDVDKRATRILLAEDQEINQLVVAEMLAQAGYKCDIVNNGREAVETLERAVYDLVLMDCQMPTMDGLEATKLIRDKETNGQLARNATIPVVALTANAMLGERDRCLDAGMTDYLSKPIRPFELIDTIEQLLCNQFIDEPDYSEQQDASPVADENQPSQVDGNRLKDETNALEDNDGHNERAIFDVDALLKRCGGKVQLAQKLISKFETRFPQDLVEMQESIGENDAERLAKAAHALKGVAATLSIESIHQAAAALEQTGRSECLDNASVQWDELRTHWETFRDSRNREKLQILEP